jgi:hypothetical protein
MRRSEINAHIEQAKDFCRANGFHLPPFAYWSPDQWAAAGHEYDEIRDNRLGWDITDFGSDAFWETGLSLFTIRNGNALHPDRYPKPYCEKLLIIGVNQVTPAHHHVAKTEDIISRGGGKLCILVHNASPDRQILDTPVRVNTDGRVYSVAAGSIVVLTAGESITLPPYVHHKFWAEGETALCGEVSTVNDDERDNVFLPSVARFADIEEDVPPVHLLCSEYPPAP